VRDKIAGQYVTGEGSLFDVPPAAIGRFRVLHQVGAGASGPVFRAVHPETGAPLAIKLFTLALLPERAAAAARDLEALVGAIPPGAGAAELVDAGLHGAAPYLVTAFAAGDSLDVALKQFGPAALVDLIPRLRTLARTLDAGAARGVLHGALHPRDVIVSDSNTVLTGLGVWPLLVRHGERLPARRPYRAPELTDAAITAEGDRFALAALAYEWMTGRRVPSAFVAQDMVPLPGVDTEAIGRAFARALHADPGERHASCEAFVDELEAVELDEAAAAPASDPSRAEVRPRRRGRAQGGASSALLPLDAFPEEADVVREEPLVGSGAAPDSGPVSGFSAAAGLEEAAGEATIAGAEGAPEPDLLPVVAGMPSARQDARGAPIAMPVPEGAGWPRLVAGLLLGSVIGLAAGYVMWGRRPATLDHVAPQAAAVAETASAPSAAPPPTTTSPTPIEESLPVAGPARPEPPRASEAPPAAAPPRPEPASEVAAGNLLIRSTPAGATVFVDDRRRGVTPLTLQKVDLGTRQVRIERDGFEAEARQVTLTPSRPSRSIDVRLTRAAAARPAPAGAPPAGRASAARTGTLVIESRPTGAAIVLNGRTIGKTPMTIDDLEPGTYTVQLQLANFRPVTTTVRVVAGARARAAASLESAQEHE